MVKKSKIVATVATLLIAAAGVITIEACNKKNETSVEPTTVQNYRKPLATYDHNHRTMTYSFDLEKINADFNRSVSKTNEGRYIVESIEILDDAPTDAEVCPEIKIVVIDTEEETSTTTWLMDAFATKNVNNGSTIYFLDIEVESGNYAFATNNEDGTVVACQVVNGEINNISYASGEGWNPRWAISCKAKNRTNCRKIKVEPHFWSCTECSSGECNMEDSWLLKFLTELVSIF